MHPPPAVASGVRAPVRRVTRQLLTTQRSARRLVRGTRDLGVLTTGRWALSHGRRDVTRAENSTVTWARADASSTTLVWVHDYWTDAYRMSGVVLAASLVREDASTVCSWSIAASGRATTRIDVREICRAAGEPLPFRGQVVLRASADELVAGRPLQVMADYVDDNGDASGVHGQYGFVARPLAQSVASMLVTAGNGARSSLVLVNTFAAAVPFQPRITLFNARGERRTATLPPLDALATTQPYYDELFTDLGTFLGGADGHASVAMPYPVSRVLSFTEHADGALVVSHGTVDRTTDQTLACPVEWDASAPLATVPATVAGCDVVIRVPNRLGRHGLAHRIVLDVRDPDGVPLASADFEVCKNGLASFDLGAFVRELGLKDGAHADVRAVPLDPHADRPALLELALGLVRDGRVVAEALGGGGFFNDLVPAGLPFPDIRRTRLFTRVQVGAGHRSVITLANPSSRGDYVSVARPDVRVLDLDGREIASIVGEIAPHGCIVLDIATVLGEAATELGPTGEAVVTVRDTECRLYGYCAIDRAGARSVRFDHMIGG